jgi:hypothetical protein
MYEIKEIIIKYINALLIFDLETLKLYLVFNQEAKHTPKINDEKEENLFKLEISIRISLALSSSIIDKIPIKI